MDRTVLPPLIADAFRAFPDDLGVVCRPHPWHELTGAPGEGLRSVRDILVHLMDNEAAWIGHVVRGEPRRHFDPASFGSLDAILAEWRPLRAGGAATILGLTEAERRSRAPLPWDAAKSVSIEEVVWHVVAHDQYHRGQVFTRLALLGRRNLPDHDLIRLNAG
jgi:uncharacterized damage-inducible protein DinB